MSTISEEVLNSMSKMDRANWNRLQASIKPTQNRINKEKAKLQTVVTELTQKINAWESEIKDFKSLAKTIEDKYVVTPSEAQPVQESALEATEMPSNAISESEVGIVDPINPFQTAEEEITESVPFM